MIFQNELLKSLQANSELTAIEGEKRSLTYRDLLYASNKVANFLLGQNIPKETPVGVLMTDRIDLICSMIGIFQAGCVFVPLDGSLPAKRLTAMKDDLALQHILTEKELAELSEEPGNEIDHPDYHENDSIYIYYTSGSTGVPKGIVGRNASLLQFLQWEIGAFGITRGTRVSQLISPYFDAFLRDVFAPLLAGGTICVPPADADFFLPEKLVDWIDRKGINLIHCVPSLFRVINNGALTDGHFQSLRYVLMSGEKINASGLGPWYKLFGSRIQLVNLYGATESTMIRAWYLIRPEDITALRIPIGMPIPETEILVLDEHLRPSEPLVPGDIYIVSDYITKGYWNNPELTRERFVTLQTEGGEKRAFKTGDKGKILPDGQIDLLGREDRQAKLRGIRVELDEIENVMARHPAVKNAVVVKRMEDNGDESLIAYIVKADTPGESKTVKEHLEEWLPAYMLPSDIIEVTEYPLLSNGKIDYKTLAERPTGTPIVPPAGPIETKLLAIWKEILGDKAISTEDSFHKIGGNSLSIMKLIGRIYKEYKVRITLSDLFSNLTIRKQAEFIKRSGKDSLYMIPVAPKKSSYAVSAVQERMYYNQELNKDSTSYNLPMAWEMGGEVAEEKIEEAFRILIDRHEVLRTEFRFVNDELRQEIRDQVAFQIEEIPYQPDLDTAIRGFLRPFDLGRAPLVRCGIIRTPEGRKVLVADFPHIICDGLSQVNLVNDLVTIYNGGVPPKNSIQYKDFAEWEYQFRATEEYLSHREFWLRNFEGEIPRLELPVTHSADRLGISDEGDSLSVEIPKSIFAGLPDSWSKKEITLSSGLFSLYYLFLSQLTGQEDIVIGIASYGRMQQELENVVGMFVKTLPFRYRLDPGKSFTDMVKEINSQLIQAYSRQVYDLANIVVELNAGRAEPIGSLFDVVFVYQGNDSVFGNGGTLFTRRPIETGSAKYPITLNVYDGESAFGLKWEYATAYFAKADMELLAAQFRSVIESVAADPDAKIIDIIGAREQATDLIEDDISFNF